MYLVMFSAKPPKKGLLLIFASITPGGGGWGTSHMKGAGMLVVSLRGVNFGFWSHLGCSGQKSIILRHEGLVEGCRNLKIFKMYMFNLFYLLDTYDQSFLLHQYLKKTITWSLLGVKKSLGHTQIGLL